MFNHLLRAAKAVSQKKWPMLAISAALGITILATPSKAQAATWYVSSLSSGTQHDGTSWATAWYDFSNTSPYDLPGGAINWSLVQPGDTIMIDAGATPAPGYVTSVGYHTPLVVGKSGTPGKPITIEVSNQAGHNGGIASIQGGNSSSTAIDIGNCSNITIQGSGWTAAGVPAKVPNLNALGYGTGIHIGPQATSIILMNINPEWCTTGINAQSGFTGNFLMVNDNQQNIVYSPSNAGQYLVLYNSWIYDSYYNTVGIVTGGQSNISSQAIIAYNIFGPGLTTGVQCNNPSTAVSIYDGLFIDPSVTSVQANSGATPLMMTGSATFVTPLNRLGQPTSCLSLTEGWRTSVSNSIFYGGGVSVTGNNRLGANNVQDNTHANTQVLSASEVDPMFASNVSAVPNNASFSTLMNLNFASGSSAGPYYPSSVAQFLQYVQ